VQTADVTGLAAYTCPHAARHKSNICLGPKERVGPKGRSYTANHPCGDRMATIATADGAWYAVLTRSRQEKSAASMLDYLAVLNFLPLITQERRWSDRKQMVSVPLFPGYLFVRIVRSSDSLLRVLKIPGVVDFVRNRNGPMMIPEKEIEDVHAALAHGKGCSPHVFLLAGDRIRVTRGALAGLEGSLIRNGSQSKVVISVEMIQRSVAVNVDLADVEPIARAAHDALSVSVFQAQ
jgi:transcription termination/antitermination protein NusG